LHAISRDLHQAGHTFTLTDVVQYFIPKYYLGGGGGG